MFDRANATGQLLDAIGALTGTYREAATYSTVTLTLTGTSGTIIPDGSLVQGGTSDPAARWRIPVTTTLSGGTASVVAQAVDGGAITANAATITQIVTPVAGWSGVTNAAAATPGRALQSDADYRLQQVAELQQAGSYSSAALRSKLLALTLDGVSVVSSCVVLDNPDNSATTIGGLAFRAHSFAPVIWPAPLTDPQIEAVAKLIFNLPVPPGSWSMGPAVTDSTGFNTTVTGADGFPHPIRGYYAIAVPIPVAVALSIAPGYELADVSDGVSAAIVAYFAALAVGGTAYLLSILTLIKAVDPAAILGATLLLDGTAADYVPAITEIVQISGGVPVVT